MKILLFLFHSLVVEKRCSFICRALCVCQKQLFFPLSLFFLFSSLNVLHEVIIIIVIDCEKKAHTKRRENNLFLLLLSFSLNNFSHIHLFFSQRANTTLNCECIKIRSQNDFCLLHFFLLYFSPFTVQNAFTEKKKLIFHLLTFRDREHFFRNTSSVCCFFTDNESLTYTCTVRNLNLTNMNGLKHYFLLCYFY